MLSSAILAAAGRMPLSRVRSSNSIRSHASSMDGWLLGTLSLNLSHSRGSA